jgi:eukaryotic-like serine/threonine-protein kinase
MDTSKPVTQIGKYEVLSELGRGGMGVVYRAEDKFIGREVAIKTLTDVTPELRQRFLVEAKSGVLNHQNIVTVYDFGEQDGSPYIVMEFLRGDSLERVLKSGRPLPLVEKLEIVRQVCEGLGYAHSKGVVHRDIKPANIMVQPDGHIKIVDFGIARLESASGHTVTGAVIGTFHYISPERLKGEPSDGRADIWACGVMLYLMLTGRLPFPGEDISALHKVVNEQFEPLSNFLTNYPPALDFIVDRALAKNPDDRFGSAEEMAADIEAINEELKRARVGEVLAQAKELLQQDQLSSVRPMLLDLQRLDPQNTEVKRLLREVQDRLSRQQRSEQLRQMVQQAEDATREQRYSEAIEIYKQAEKLDPTNHGFTSKIQQIRELKEKSDKLESLKTQAREARHRNDLSAAARLIGEALKLDEKNTDLRNEQARILQEQDRLAKEQMRRKLKDAGRDNLAGRQYTGAIQVLREALELDPTDAEAQQMFQDAVSKQEEERRRKIIEQIVTEIQDQIFRGQLGHALELIGRALERLPGEAVLLRLKAETQKKHAEATAQKLVEDTSMQVQTLFFTAPQEALAIVQQALDVMPGEERLLALQQRVIEQLKRSNLEGLRSQYLTQAQAAVGGRDYDQAIQVLEGALLDCGESPEIHALLEYARSEKLLEQRKQTADATIREAQQLIGSGSLEEAIALLQRASNTNQDAAVDQLLKQTQERFEEVGRRVEAVLSRIQKLSETDPVQALQLLQSQPQAIQQHPQMRTLRSKVDARGEQERVTREAVKRADEQLQQGQLRDGLDTLETVRQAYGDFPEIAAAIELYKTKRIPLANTTLNTAMAQARQAVLAQEAPRALELLRKSSSVLEFGDASLQGDWKRLADEVTKAAGAKRGTTESLPIVVQGSKVSPKLVISIAAAVLLIVLGAVLALRPKPAVVTSYLQLNASPFAEVLSITPQKGSPLGLPAGDHSTPMRIEGVPEGAYAVVFRKADGKTETVTCTVSDTNHRCMAQAAPLSDGDIDAIVAGGKQ